MEIVNNPSRSTWAALMKRPLIDRSVITGRVQAILDDVKERGDEAIITLAREIEGVTLTSLEVIPQEIVEAEALVPDNLKRAIDVAITNIEKFHAAQRMKPIEVMTSPGVRCVQRALPVRSVGLYVPGGSAPLFSTVLMLAVPARVAGCPEIVLCTPTDRHGRVAPAVLYAANRAGVKRIFKAGGAQAIAAMAYGTRSVPRVDKIFGPGNQYVTMAKQMVSNSAVSIDMPAGPSEVLVMADSTAVAAFVAADLLSQAEHGPDSQVILLASSQSVARAVASEVERQLTLLPRAEIAQKALSNSRMIVFDSTAHMVEFSNLYGPEHLIISLENPWMVAEQITSAGSVFLGNYTPESAGDYASGTNHTLPTNGWAHSCSGVNLDSFTRKITYQEISREGLDQLGPVIETMATGEGLDAHRNAVSIRLAFDSNSLS